MLRNVTNISIENVQSSVAFRISLNFFKFFPIETRKITNDEPNLNADESAVVNCS